MNAKTSTPVRLGMIGVGYVGQVGHLLNFLEADNCDVVAIADLRSGLRETVRSHHGIPAAYETHHELLQNEDVDAVAVVTRPYHVGAIALDCLNAGKHVFTEKPMAVTIDQSEKLVAAAAANDVRYAVGYMRRYDTGVQLAKRKLDEVMQSGELGRILFARFYCFGGEDFCNCPGAVGLGEPRPDGIESWPKAPDWLPAEHAGAYIRFMNIYIHDLNLMRYLFGRTPQPEHFRLVSDQHGSAAFDFGDFQAVLECAEMAQDEWTEGVEILFEKGRMTIDLPAAFRKEVPATVTLCREGYSGRAETFTLEPSWSFRNQAQTFIDDILAGREPVSSGRDSIEDSRLLEGIWRLAGA